MAKILYALSGANRGHTSRVLAITEDLRARGHQIIFCGGGRALEILEELGETVLPVPAIQQVMDGNRVRLGRTFLQNVPNYLFRPSIWRKLLPKVEAFGPDLVVSDFETYAARAARRLGVPVLSFNHQQVVTETRYEVPRRFWLEAMLTRSAINSIVPRRPEHILVSSFFFPEVKDPSRTTLIKPIIRRAVQRARPEKGAHTLVYLNQPEGAGKLLETLRAVDAPFVVYGFEPPAGDERWGNLLFRKPSMEGFLDDLATSRSVICTAGYTLLSEALYLGKPMLVWPNKGTFEQTINALYLERDGLGEAVYHRPIEVADVSGFLSRVEQYEVRLPFRSAYGNDMAVGHIEEILRRSGALEPARTRRAVAVGAQIQAA